MIDMAGLNPAIEDFYATAAEGVDARHKAGRDSGNV